MFDGNEVKAPAVRGVLRISHVDSVPKEGCFHALDVLLLLGRQLLMSRRCRVYDQRFRIADICQMRQELNRVDKLFACFTIAFDSEAHKGSIAFFQIFCSNRVIGIVFKPRIIHPADQRMLCQMPGNGKSIFAVPLLPQRQRLKALQKKK